MADEVKVDDLLNTLLLKVEEVEQFNSGLRKQISDLQNQLNKYVADGSLTEVQLKKIQDAVERLSRLVS